MPRLDGIAATRHIKSRWPEIRIIARSLAEELRADVLAAGADAFVPKGALVQQLLEALGHQTGDQRADTGAFGYLLKDSAPEDVLQAVGQAYRGETVLHPAIARMVLQELHRAPQPKQPATTDPLSERELEVLRLVAQGMSNQEIANALVVGEATVRSHVSAILSWRKLQLASRTQAALYALRQRLALDEAPPAR
jgi:DNA-binding NarL/FixJ family response regulator